MTDFLENLKIALSQSQYDLCLENRKTDLEYQQFEKEYHQLFDKIRNRLGKKRKWMLRLEELGNAKGSIDDDHIYLQGFLDCVTLLKFIKLI
jgi:hypothetical protein